MSVARVGGGEVRGGMVRRCVVGVAVTRLAGVAVRMDACDGRSGV